MPEGTMHRLARGERTNPSWKTLLALARGYDQPISEIVAILAGETSRLAHQLELTCHRTAGRMAS